MLDTDLRWSTGPSWTTFSTIFGLFPGGPRSVPRTFFINGKALQIGSRGVFGWFWRFFSEVFRKVFRSIPRTPGWFWGTFGKNGSGVGRGSGGGSGGLPNEDSYTNCRYTALRPLLVIICHASLFVVAGQQRTDKPWAVRRSGWKAGCFASCVG